MSEPIAIVGSACRFPGSIRSPYQLWKAIIEQRDVLTQDSSARFGLASFYDEDPNHHGRTDVRGNAYLLEDDIRQFDAAFFHVSYKEAHSIDPQQRILLETVYEAFEAAGWPLDRMEGSETSVHVGCMTADYHDMQMRDPETLSVYTATGTARSILSNRISYFFDLKGPSITLDTACSSSLVALHQAVQCLRNGEADQAIVAGTTMVLDTAMYVAESNLHMISPDSRSRMWDKDANGYARGEGCAVVLLKPLSAAIADKDNVECVIRETGVNSDGRTSGITMPSAAAQASLIRRTYERAGLDPTLLHDRCQYFECHGTGTQAGDPVEARAINDAFLPVKRDTPDNPPLFCGSIKTNVGHLEGCAGLAGLLKASLALQHKKIPPNMHFNQINPAIKPYYEGLQVPVAVLPWPETHGEPLRASINSFGFGGTNAHVILESHCSQAQPISEARTRSGIQDAQHDQLLLGPFVFSAAASSSLHKMLQNMHSFVLANPGVDLDALSWALQSRRTKHSFRAVALATNRAQLLGELSQLQTTCLELDVNTTVSNLAPHSPRPEILAIFTGQGAQWTRMGQALIANSSCFRESLERCDEMLKAIPDPPTWSLVQQMTCSTETSHIDEAQYTQPICTAVQIALVDMLAAAGIRPHVAVGHSSGEIAAAYAAGILTIRDAMGIAYYRGAVAHLVRGTNNEKGGMVAVAMSLDQSENFCSQHRFAGRLVVAASNGPSIVTLSGDLDAIHEAKETCDSQGVFAKVLKVDVAYHSHHMIRCEKAYRQYLEGLEIQLCNSTAHRCIWYSSVYQNTDSGYKTPESLRGSYWVDNMVRPVLFSQALGQATSEGHVFAMAVEIGPHPTLRRPTILSLKSEAKVSEANFAEAYSGTLHRDQHDIRSMSRAIGSIWKNVGSYPIDFFGWRRAFGKTDPPRMLQNLPSYPWHHSQQFWSESRISKNVRLSSRRPHELLGRVHECEAGRMTWRNVLIEHEIPWLAGHSFQGQTLFPAAGYTSMVVEAAQQFADHAVVRLIEISDMNIAKALVVDKDSDGIETIFTVSSSGGARQKSTEALITAEFSLESCANGRTLERNCDGRLLIHLDPNGPGMLAPIGRPQTELPPLDPAKFFAILSRLGIEYSGPFRAIHSMNRIWGYATSSASWAAPELGTRYTLHPAILDVGFQTAFATFSSMAEDSMGTTFLPARIKRLMVDPSQIYLGHFGDIEASINAQLIASTKKEREVELVLWSGMNNRPAVQVDGLILQAIAEPPASLDRQLFVTTKWNMDIMSGFKVPEPKYAEKKVYDYIDAVERTSLFYMKRCVGRIAPDMIKGLRWHHQALLEAIRCLIKPIEQGTHPILRKEWLCDDRATIVGLRQSYPDSVDLALLTAVGENLPSVMQGESEMLEHMLKDDMLSRLYTEGRGFSACNDQIADFMRQIAHKFPHVKVLELGAGTGGTTCSVLNAMGGRYSSYTFTDISPGFFERARQRLCNITDRVGYKTLNIENPPEDQGFALHAYDVIIAANVLHATRRLDIVLRHTRRLLKPGGYLLMIEVTGSMLRETGLMGGLEGWWLGRDQGRFPTPGVSVEAWHQLLCRTGFSGVDSVVYDMPDKSRHNCSAMVTQALDKRCTLLRDPLAQINLIPTPSLLVIGGCTAPVAEISLQARRMLSGWLNHIATISNLNSLEIGGMSSGSTVLYLAELDQPMFSKGMDATTLLRLQQLLSMARNVLWVTAGRLADEPYANMMVGAGRAIRSELPELQMQSLDFEEKSAVDVVTIVQHLVRMVACSQPTFSQENILWVNEPEVRVNGRKQLLVPRLVPDVDANRCLNAERRQVTTQAGASDVVTVAYTGQRPYLVSQERHMGTRKDLIEVEVKLSVALHVPGDHPCFLCFGLLSDRKTAVFAISECNTSLLCTTLDEIFLPKPTIQCDAGRLVLVGLALIVTHVDTTSHGTILLHDPPPELATLILQTAPVPARQIICVSPSAERRSPAGWLNIHPLAQIGTVRQSLPPDTSMLWQFSNVDCKNIVSCLPMRCRTSRFSLVAVSRRRELLAASLELALRVTIAPRPVTIGLRDVDKFLVSEKLLSVVLSWERLGPVQTIVRPPRLETVLSPYKTYLLVGMTGDLGQSLCRSMTSSGALHIVIASRTATDEIGWIQGLRLEGLDIRAAKMDVAKREDVRKTAAWIHATMPPLAGVANAALVLEDSLFINTTVKSITNQILPKVDGSINLDAELHSTDLDFFILFSSLGSEYGNPGQSIYHAANLFLASFANKRRKQGRCASVMNIGMCVDVGYVARNTRRGTDIEQHLRSEFYAPIAETEFHQMFLRAILCGAPDSISAEITMGIEPFVQDSRISARPRWYDNPRFSHMVLPYGAAGNSESRSHVTPDRLGLREKLEPATTRDDVFEVLQQEFAGRVVALTKVPMALLNPEAPLSALGLDSLLAVEIRTWLLKEFLIDVSILEILDHQSITSICSRATDFYLTKSGSLDSSSSTKEHSTVEVSDFDDDTSTSNIDEMCIQRSPTGSGDGTSYSLPASEISVASSIRQDANDERKITEHRSSGWEHSTALARTSPMTPAQASLYFLHKIARDPSALNVTAVYTITGTLSATRFQRALETTIARHSAFQTCFSAKSGTLEPCQSLHEGPRKDYLSYFQSDDRTAVEHEFQRLTGQVWDISRGDTFHATLVSHSPVSHTVLFGVHHIVMDGMSWHIFPRELDLAYRMQVLPRIPPSTFDAAQKQQAGAAQSGLEASVDYWARALSPLPDVVPLLPLARTRVRQPLNTWRNHVISRQLDADLMERVRIASQRYNATLMHFCLAIVQSLFARMLEIEEMCIGVTAAGRPSEFLETIGHFALLQPMVFKWSKEETFDQLLRRTKAMVTSGMDHPGVSIDMILQKLGVQRATTHLPLCQVAFNYRVGSVLHGRLGECSMDLSQYADARTPLDLTFNVTKGAQGGHLVEVVSNAALYSDADTQIVMNTYVDLLASLSVDQSRELGDYTLHSVSGIQSALQSAVGEVVPLAKPNTLIERLCEVVRSSPNHVAIKFGGTSMTYHGMFTRVQELSTALFGANVQAGDLVAVLCEPGIDLWVAMLAILHRGSIYVPFDTSLPSKRHEAMIRVCQPRLLLFHDATALSSHNKIWNGITHMHLCEIDDRHTGSPPLVTPADEAFRLFTSGSTGTPKCIKLTQSGIMNYIEAKQDFLHLERPVVLQQSSVGFDISLAQAFNAFANGGTLVVAPPDLRGDPLALARLMADEAVDFTLATPSEYTMLTTYAIDTLGECSHWRFACSGGELVTDCLINAFRQLNLPRLILADCYGPTETSCAVCIRLLSLSSDTSNYGEPLSVGRVIPNMSVYILDDNQKPLPAGFSGEICIAGVGVAKGYVDPEATAKSFTTHWFSSGKRILLYRTGDKGCLRHDGSLIFLGRMDGNLLVKLRGIRVDMGEIEQAILATAQGSLASATVTVRGQPEFFVAHVLASQGQGMDEEKLDQLRRDLPLPTYMIPSMIVLVNALPTTINRKVDRKAISNLPLPLRNTRSIEGASRLNVAEGEMCLLWRRALGQAVSKEATITPNSDFLECGGSSLLLVRLQNLIREEMGILIPLHTLYGASTLRKMTALASEGRSRLQENDIDWDAETALPDAILDITPGQATSSSKRPRRNVVLTGATGFLGGEILTALLGDEDVTKIYCVAVSEEQIHRLPEDDRIVVHTGSLLSPHLGLSAKAVADLRACVNQIIHAGANGHCLNNYSSVRSANYLSTQFLASLAIPRRASLHFISSPRVILQSGHCARPPGSMLAHPPTVDGSQGFTSSKWASEVFLERLCKRRPFRAVVHRPCSVIGSQAPHDDAMNSIIRYSVLSGQVPDVPGADGFFDFKDVKDVANDITKAPAPEEGICFYQYSSGVKVPFKHLAQRMEFLYGGPFETVSMQEWIDGATKLGIEDLIVRYLEANVAGTERLTFPYMGQA